MYNTLSIFNLFSQFLSFAATTASSHNDDDEELNEEVCSEMNGKNKYNRLLPL